MEIFEKIMDDHNIEQKMMVSEAHIRIVDKYMGLKI